MGRVRCMSLIYGFGWRKARRSEGIHPNATFDNGVSAAAHRAIEGYTEGPGMVIAMLLGAILGQLSTRR